MDERVVEYIGIPVLVILLAIILLPSYGHWRLVALLIDVVALILVIIVYYADFIVFPLITMVLGIKTVPAKNYVIPPDQSCVIKNVSGLYYATGYLSANIYNYVFSAEQIDVEESAKLALGPERWERIVMNVKFPFKFHLVTYSKEVQSYRDELEGKRGYLEFQLSKEMESKSPSQMTVDDLQRRVNVIQARIERLSAGERPVGSVMYIETTAVGVSEKAARDTLNTQVSQLQTVFNGLDLSITRVIGRELYVLFKFGYMLPTTVAEIESTFSVQR